MPETTHRIVEVNSFTGTSVVERMLDDVAALVGINVGMALEIGAVVAGVILELSDVITERTEGGTCEVVGDTNRSRVTGELKQVSTESR